MIKEMKEISIDKEISQAKIAQDLGVTLNTVNRWFKGIHKPHQVFEAKIKMWVKKHER